MDNETTVDERVYRAVARAFGDNMFLHSVTVHHIVRCYLRRCESVKLFTSQTEPEMTRIEHFKTGLKQLLQQFVYIPPNLTVLVQRNAIPVQHSPKPRPFGIWYWYTPEYSLADEMFIYLDERYTTNAATTTTSKLDNDDNNNEEKNKKKTREDSIAQLRFIFACIKNCMAVMMTRVNDFWSNVTAGQMRGHLLLTSFNYTRDFTTNYWAIYFIVTTVKVLYETLVDEFSRFPDLMSTRGREVSEAIFDCLRSIRWPDAAVRKEHSNVNYDIQENILNELIHMLGEEHAHVKDISERIDTLYNNLTAYALETYKKSSEELQPHLPRGSESEIYHALYVDPRTGAVPLSSQATINTSVHSVINRPPFEIKWFTR